MTDASLASLEYQAVRMLRSHGVTAYARDGAVRALHIWQDADGERAEWVTLPLNLFALRAWLIGAR